MSFPDIACRAKAVVIDDGLGIIVDGKAAQDLKAAGAPASTAEQAEILNPPKEAEATTSLR